MKQGEKMKSNKFVLVIVCACLAVFLVACTSCKSKKNGNLTIASVRNQTSNSFSATYSYFNGEREYTIKVKDGNPLAVKVNVTTDDGDLSISVDKKGGGNFYQGNKIPTFSFTLNLKESGTYVVKIKANKHSGSYSFEW